MATARPTEHTPFALAEPLIVCDAGAIPLPDHGMVVAVDRVGALPPVDPASCDVLMSTRPDAPAPWVSIVPARLDAQLARVRHTIAAAPIAATVLCRLLRLNANLDFAAALELESLAYSTLLGGEEFRRWLAGRGPHEGSAFGAVEYARDDDAVRLTLNSPETRNAMTASMRDALHEALTNVIDDPSLPSLVLRGAGRCFSTGGDLGEFGTARDLAAAHLIRTERSCAALLHQLGSRAEVRLHGACIGSGIEVAAACARVIGAPDTFVQLPELAMGLIPGAGGTVTVSRRIGRHRAAWLALSGARLAAREARRWGLLDEIEA